VDRIAAPSYTHGYVHREKCRCDCQGDEHHSGVENYPDGKGPMRGARFEERFRGKHELQRDENGLEKCVACFLCAAACPANCIYIEAADNTDEARISSSERYAKVYNIDYNRCIFCGYCVEACPTDAITHGHGFELASLNATSLVMRKEDLLVNIQSADVMPNVVTSASEETAALA
jgi:NADH-quinone oxidoreductase subunit I